MSDQSDQNGQSDHTGKPDQSADTDEMRWNAAEVHELRVNSLGGFDYLMRYDIDLQVVSVDESTSFGDGSGEKLERTISVLAEAMDRMALWWIAQRGLIADLPDSEGE